VSRVSSHAKRPRKLAPDAPRRVVAYLRISRFTEESTSIERQRALAVEECERRGWELVEAVEDVDVSATKTRLDRPGLHRVRELIRAGRVDTVLVWRLDRLARSVTDLANLVEEWGEYGAVLTSATEAFDATTDSGRAMMQLLGIFAEFEAATIRARVTASRAALAKAHRHPGGSPPFGYRSAPHPSGVGRALEVHPEEAALVRRAADSVLGGATLYATLQEVRASGIKPRKADAWAISSLRQVLVGDAILGRMRNGGELVRDEYGFPVAVWEPVLPLEDVERLRALLAPKPPSARRRRAARVLSGLVECLGCGGTLRVNKSAQVFRYTCHAKTDGRACPHPTSIVCGLLEEYVEREFLAVMGRTEVVLHETVVREAAEVAKVAEAIRDTADAMTRPGADLATLVARLGELTARRDALAAQPAAPEVVERATGETVAEAWARSDAAGRRSLLAHYGLARRISVGPGRRGGWKTFQADRLTIPWRWDPEHAAESLAEEDFDAA
jgi:site-specific DNA recombinase